MCSGKYVKVPSLSLNMHIGSIPRCAVYLQEMDSIESAQQILESDLRFQFNMDGAPLRLDYSHAAQPPAAISASASSDWVCRGCSAINFSRYFPLYLHSGRAQCAIADYCGEHRPLDRAFLTHQLNIIMYNENTDVHACQLVINLDLFRASLVFLEHVS